MRIHRNKKRYQDVLLFRISCLVSSIHTSYTRKPNNEVVFPGPQNLPNKVRQHCLLSYRPLSILLLCVFARMLRRFRMNVMKLSMSHVLSHVSRVSCVKDCVLFLTQLVKHVTLQMHHGHIKHDPNMFVATGHTPKKTVFYTLK